MNLPLGLNVGPKPSLQMIVEIYPDGHAQLINVPNNPMVLMDILRMLIEQNIKIQKEAVRQAAGGLVLPVSPIRRSPLNGE